MKRLSFALKDKVIEEQSNLYNFSDEERDEYIAEISARIREDVRRNDIKAMQSREFASRFVCI